MRGAGLRSCSQSRMRVYCIWILGVQDYRLLISYVMNEALEFQAGCVCKPTG